MRAKALPRLGFAVAAVLVANVPILNGQACLSAEEAGEVLAGQVVDASTRVPVGGASIELFRADSSCAGLGHYEVVTGADGHYQFDGLGFGRYELNVKRLGYRPVMVTVELGRGAALRVSLGMQAVAIALDPILGERPRPGRQAFGTLRPTPAEAVTAFRADFAQDRQLQFLPTDVRSITEADLDEAITLAEPDVLRALQSLPGVTTRDDFTAELWTRGGAADQTRVYFDGLPLYSPFHLLGVFSGVNTDAVGAITFQPGVRSAELGEGAASVVGIETRRASSPDLRGTAGLSPISARVSAARQFQDGRGGWMLSARRTFVDGLSSVLSGVGVASVSRVPYAFSDVTGRTDVALGGRTMLEWSGLYQEDRVSGDIPRLAAGNRARWGNAASRLTITTALGGVLLRNMVGFSRFDASVDEMSRPDSSAIPAHPQTRNRIDHLRFESRLTPVGQGATQWAAGVQASVQRHTYDGPTADPTGIPRGSERGHGGAVGLRDIIAAAIGLDRLRLDEELRQVAVWAERRWNVLPHTIVETGLRIEASDAVWGQSPARLAPRISGQFRAAGGRLRLSAGWGRSFQYTQSLVRTHILRSGLRASEVWLMAGDTVPAIRADVFTVGGEFWLGEGWLGSANLYRRNSAGLIVPDPAPGLVTTRELFQVASGRAEGVELSLRKLTGVWTWSAAYGYGTSTLDAGAFTFAAPEERRHTLHTSLFTRIWGAWRVGGSFKAAGGTAFTPAVLPDLMCDAGGVCTPSTDPVRLGDPGSGRTPAYASLNALVDWTHQYDAWALGVYFQLHNVLGRQNAVTYNSSFESGSGETRDVFEDGLPRLPTLGIRVWF